MTTVKNAITGEVVNFDVRLYTKNENYTFILADIDGTFVHNSDSSHTWTIQPQSIIDWPDGAKIHIAKKGGGVLTIARGSGVSLFNAGTSTDGNISLAAGSYFSTYLFKFSDNVWVLEFGASEAITSWSNVVNDGGKPANNADVTSANTAAAIAGQGALATQSSVNLASGEVTNKTGANITYTSGGGTLDSLKPVEAGANKVLNLSSNLVTASSIQDDTGVDLSCIVPEELNSHYEDSALTGSPLALTVEGVESSKYPGNPIDVPINGHRLKYQYAFQYKSYADTIPGVGLYRVYTRTDGGSWLLVVGPLSFSSSDGVNWSTLTASVGNEFTFPPGSTFEIALTFERLTGSTTGMYVQNVELDIVTEFFK